MTDPIVKPDASPVVFGALNLFAGCLGYLVMGQRGKALVAFVYTGISCGLFAWVAAIDGYLLGRRLAAGEAVGSRDNGLALLDSLPGFR